MSETMPEAEFAALERRYAQKAGELLDGFIGALHDFSTEELRGIADYREAIDPAGWYHRLIREYVEVWR